MQSAGRDARPPDCERRDSLPPGSHPGAELYRAAQRGWDALIQGARSRKAPNEHGERQRRTRSFEFILIHSVLSGDHVRGGACAERRAARPSHLSAVGKRARAQSIWPLVRLDGSLPSRPTAIHFVIRNWNSHTHTPTLTHSLPLARV